MFIPFDRMYERDRHTDGQTDRQTPHDDIGRACVASRCKKTVVVSCRTVRTHRNRYNIRNERRKTSFAESQHSTSYSDK